MDVPSEGKSGQNQELIDAAESALKKRLEKLAETSYPLEPSVAVIAAAYALQVARGDTPSPLSLSLATGK